MKPSKSYRHTLELGAAAAVIALAAPGLATGQEPLETSPAEETQTGPAESIQVTGSRILRDPNLASPVPVQSLDSEAIQMSGEVSLGDIVNRIPALLASSSGENSSTGANALNLRGLGSSRTLTLVNGRRHVAGFEGSQAVDIGSIPRPLIERVEVLTGGASAVYGSDAVTGVVNFILRDDYEGVNMDARVGISGQGDGETASLQITAGRNFHQGRGNVVISADLSSNATLRYGDRDWSRDNGVARNQANPALRFQNGDITQSATPNFFQFYNFDITGRYPYGFAIPSAAAFATAYQNQFGVAPNLSAEEQALFDRAANAPSRAILRQPTFSISSKRGVISPGNFGLAPGVDLNGSGIDDCLESYVGWNNSLAGNGSFGFAGGCWVVNDDGSVRPYQDGLVAGNFNQFGGDGIEDNFNETFLLPRQDTATLNLNARYDLTPSIRAFAELKYSASEAVWGTPLNTFYDLLYGAPDNPFLPAELRDLANQTGGLYITRDPTDLGPNQTTTERETIRAVAGLEGEFRNGWNWELSVNHGEFTRTQSNTNAVMLDRFFAAIDVVSDAAGNPVCRSDLDPSAVPPTTIFDIPFFDPGFYSFTPGSGQCAPANIWGGPGAISQEAISFITTPVSDELKLTQTVVSASLVGDSSDFFTLPAGPVQFATGAEYRREESRNSRNPLALGIIPAGAPFPEGTLVSDVSDNGSLGFNADSQFFDSSGSYDVTDVFIELSVPILADMPLAEELTLDGAYRYADYSTVGGAETWKLGLIWTPVSDLSFRGTVSQAIRAPNIDELFRPNNPAFFRPVDPCDAAEIGNAPDPALRQANCLADGLPEGFADPLSARFAGVSGGNPDLTEEKADTVTLGFVFTPRFLQGFTLTVDYWDVKIEDGISQVSAQDIVDTCYDSSTFPNDFCDLFERETSPTSPQFGGFRFLNQSFVNFASIEATGYDFAATYQFSWRENDFGIGLSGTKQESLDFFTNPLDPTEVNPALMELQRPEWAVNGNLSWTRGPLRLGWQTRYMSEQALSGVQIETIEALYGPDGMAGEVFIHDFNASYQLNEVARFYGGVNNVEDRAPFITETAWPVGPRGRFFFVGVDVSF